MAAIVLPAVFTAVDKFSSPIGKMDRSVTTFSQRAEARINRVNRAFRKLSPSVGKVFKQLLAYASLTALITFGISAVNVAKDYEQANANLASVMGTTIEKNEALAKESQRLGAITARSATEVVTLQEAYARLGFAQAEIIDVTQATIDGSIAMNAELAETATLTGAMIRTFDKFSSADAPEILDQITLATQKSALNFEKLNTSLPIVAGAANAAGIPFTKLLSLLGKLSDAGIDASSSATSLRNIFLESAKKGLSYDKILEKIVASTSKLTGATDAFGKRAAVSAVVLGKELSATAQLTELLDRAAKGHDLSGVAALTAAKQLDTLGGSMTLLRSAWQGLIIDTGNSTGALQNFRALIDFVTQNLATIINVIVKFALIFVALKTAILLARFSLLAYNIMLGVTGALSKSASIAIGGNIVALKAYQVAVTLASIAGKIWAVVMNLGIWPILLIVGAIVGLIFVVKAIIKKFKTWGEFLSFLAKPFKFIIALVKKLGAVWKRIRDAFRFGGIVEGFKAIGRTILRFVLAPVRMILKIISRLPGKMGKWAAKAELKIKNLTEATGPTADVSGTAVDESGRIVNVDETNANTLSETVNRSVEQQVLTVNVNDRNNNTTSDLNGEPLPVNITPILDDSPGRRGGAGGTF